MAVKKFKMLNLICENCTLTSKEKLVAQYFVYKSNKAGECYPSVATISKHCGVSQRTVQRATKKLQEKNYIIIEKRYYKGRQSSNQYSLNTAISLDYNEEVTDNNEIGNMEVLTLTDILGINGSIDSDPEVENLEAEDPEAKATEAKVPEAESLKAEDINIEGTCVKIEMSTYGGLVVKDELTYIDDLKVVTEERLDKGLLNSKPRINIINKRELTIIHFILFYKIVTLSNNYKKSLLVRKYGNDYYILILKVYNKQYKILLQLYTYDFFMPFLGVTW